MAEDYDYEAMSQAQDQSDQNEQLYNAIRDGSIVVPGLSDQIGPYGRGQQEQTNYGYGNPVSESPYSDAGFGGELGMGRVPEQQTPNSAPYMDILNGRTGGPSDRNEFDMSENYQGGGQEAVRSPGGDVLYFRKQTPYHNFSPGGFARIQPGEDPAEVAQKYQEQGYEVQDKPFRIGSATERLAGKLPYQGMGQQGDIYDQSHREKTGFGLYDPKIPLSQAEVLRMNKLKQGLSSVQQALEARQITPQMAEDLKLQLRTGIDPLQKRQQMAMEQQRQMQMVQMQQQMAAQKAFEAQNGVFDTQMIPKRLFTDPQTGQRLYVAKNGDIKELPMPKQQEKEMVGGIDAEDYAKKVRMAQQAVAVNLRATAKGENEKPPTQDQMDQLTRNQMGKMFGMDYPIVNQQAKLQREGGQTGQPQQQGPQPPQGQAPPSVHPQAPGFQPTPQQQSGRVTAPPDLGPDMRMAVPKAPVPLATPKLKMDSLPESSYEPPANNAEKVNQTTNRSAIDALDNLPRARMNDKVKSAMANLKVLLNDNVNKNLKQDLPPEKFKQAEEWMQIIREYREGYRLP